MRVYVTVDARKRISLGPNVASGTRYLVEVDPDTKVITLTPVVSVPVTMVDGDLRRRLVERLT